MDLVTIIGELADAKGRQVRAWNLAQGIKTPDYDSLIEQIKKLSFGELDEKIAFLRTLSGAVIPDEVRTLLLLAIKETAELISETEIKESAFKNSAIVYHKGGLSSKTSLVSLFEGCSLLTLVEGLDVSKATSSTYNLFRSCVNLKCVDFSAPVNASNAGSMFCDCKKLSKVIFPEGSFQKTRIVENMFCNCSALENIYIPEGAFENVTDAVGLFYHCQSLKSINIPNSSTSFKTVAFSNMFAGCTSLTSIIMDFSVLRNATSVRALIMNCRFLEADTISNIVDNVNWNQVTDAGFLFYNVRGITKFQHLETVALTTADSMFQGSPVQNVEINLSKVTLSGWNRSSPRIFYACANLKKVTLDGGLASLRQAAEIFAGCKALTTIVGLTLPSLYLTVADYGYNGETLFSKVAKNLFTGCSSLTDCELGGTLYKSGIDLRPCAKLSARSIYTWVAALYDWGGNPEGKTTDDTDHTLYLTDAQQTTLMDYAGDDGESGEEAYLTALDRGWTISA